MPLDRPTLVQLVALTQADVLARADISDPLRRADAMVYARVLAGLIHGVNGLAQWISKQILPDTAEEEILERWASIWLQQPRKPAARATGTVTFQVQPGAVIDAGVLVQALDGQQYETTAAATGAAPVYTAPVEAVVAGSAGNRTAGQSVSLVSPVTGVQANAVTSEVSGGANREDIEDLRARVLARIRSTPQGGSKADYEAWALEVPGVTRAWISPGELGAGTVVVRFVRDADVSLIPDAGEVAVVQAYVDELRPVTAAVTVVAPVAAPLNFVFTSLTPDTAPVRAAVTAELEDLLRREASPGGTLLLSRIRAAISSVAAEADYTLTAPAANVVAPTGSLTTMGAITWP